MRVGRLQRGLCGWAAMVRLKARVHRFYAKLFSPGPSPPFSAPSRPPKHLLDDPTPRGHTAPIAAHAPSPFSPSLTPSSAAVAAPQGVAGSLRLRFLLQAMLLLTTLSAVLPDICTPGTTML